MDWSRTPVGPIESWPQSLKTAVNILLNSRYPMFVWWGRELTNIYNDAYMPMLSARHPRVLGRSAARAWADVWPVVGPQAEVVMTREEALGRTPEELRLLAEWERRDEGLKLLRAGERVYGLKLASAPGAERSGSA